MKRTILFFAACACLASCGQQAEQQMAYDDNVEEAATDAEVEGETKSIPVQKPQIAYSYSIGFRTNGNRIAMLQKKHADMCEKAGPSICHLLNMEQSGGEGEYTDGLLEIEVSADKARAFLGSLSDAAASDDATQISSSISGEDLSKDIIDTESRLNARKLLRDRLMNILATNKGSVEELVTAERAVSDVTSEIEVAESRLADMKGRVSFSKVLVSYSSSAASGGGFWNPIREAVNDFSGVLGSVIGGIISFLAVILPIAIFAGLVIWLIKLARRRGYLHLGLRDKLRNRKSGSAKESS